jgi:hypothetical protein
MDNRQDLTYRKVDVADIEHVVNDVNQASLNEPRYGEVNPAHMGASWRALVGVGIATGIGAYVGKECVGFVFGLCSHDPLTGEKTGTAYLWAVKPEHRGGGTAYELLTLFEQWVKEQGGTSVVIGVQESPKADKLARAHRRKGYVQASRALRKKLT